MMLNIDMQFTKLIANLKQGDPVHVPPEPRTEEEIIVNWGSQLDNPLLSIVCITYNHASFIKDALNGFLMQKTDFPYEIIVHDDASTDGTINILRDYKSKYPRLFKLLIQEENQYRKGMGPLGFAFPLARGKYIAYCEGDDYWIDENKIFKQVSFLEANPDFSITYTNSVSFSGSHCLGIDFGGSKVDLTCDELQKAPGIFTLTACFRNALDNPVELNYAAYGDKFIWSMLGKFGKGKYMEDIAPSFYRVHAGGVHSLASDKTRLFMNIKTFLALSVYHKRIGNATLEKYFLEKSLFPVICINGISPRLIPFMRMLTGTVKKIKLVLQSALTQRS